MKKIFSLLALILLMSGCARDAKVYPGLFGSNVVGDEYGVKIDNLWNASDALHIADKHCDRFGKKAFIVGQKDYVGIYDCVKQNISGNKNYVSLTLFGDEEEALPFAEKHCNKYGRSATYKSKEKYKVIFDCID